MSGWITGHLVEIFGAVTGILFVFLEIRQNIWLWPVGIITSAVYVFVFFGSKFYADMGLQVYYLGVSIYGWYWWLRGGKDNDSGSLPVTRVKPRLALLLGSLLVVLFVAIWLILSELTDSPVPGWDSFTTSVSIIATWMLARKYIEHWFLWMVANIVSVGLYIFKGLYPTVILFSVYTAMSFVGYFSWRKEFFARSGSQPVNTLAE
ncbi:MAG: nicotinamide riboside transporter PnuC [Bacteroidales bacterium]